MRRSLILLAFLTASARADELTLTQVRTTHGILGPTRTDKRVLPGDSVYVSFNIEGLKPDASGKVKYSTAIEITDSAGKIVFRQPAKMQEITNTLGGNQVPAYAQLDIGLSQPSGDFTFNLIVKDEISGKSQTLTHKGQLQPKAFGLVRLTTSADSGATVPSGLLGPGQSLFINALVVEFARGGANKQPKIDLEMKVLDEAGKPVLTAPMTGTIEANVPADALAMPIQFHVSLNRPGKFTVELKATDKISGKTDTRTFPITVHQP